jgi:Holliday junction resolvase
VYKNKQLKLFNWRVEMKSATKHQIDVDDKQIEFLVKCIDISQSTQSIHPDKSEVEIIRKLSELNEDIQETKLDDTIYYDLN